MPICYATVLKSMKFNKDFRFRSLSLETFYRISVIFFFLSVVFLISLKFEEAFFPNSVPHTRKRRRIDCDNSYVLIIPHRMLSIVLNCVFEMILSLYQWKIFRLNTVISLSRGHLTHDYYFFIYFSRG